MRRLALAAFVALSVEGAASARAEPPARPTADPDASDDDGGATIQKGKRPHLKLDGTTADDQRASHAPAPADDDPPTPLRLGPATYKGVAPGAPNLPPRAPKLPVAGPARMTWPGFQVRDGVPTVFLELTGTVEWSVAAQPGKIVYTLKNTTVPVRNNRRALDVRAFKVPVKEIDARPKGKDVRVTVVVRSKVDHREHVEDAAGGFKLLVIELPGS
jgi:hypothetical protein